MVVHGVHLTFRRVPARARRVFEGSEGLLTTQALGIESLDVRERLRGAILIESFIGRVPKQNPFDDGPEMLTPLDVVLLARCKMCVHEAQGSCTNRKARTNSTFVTANTTNACWDDT